MNQVSAAPGHLEVVEQDGVATIKICNVSRFNAMSLGMWEHLAELVEQAEHSDQIRVLVLTGEGDQAFVSGADISEFGTLRNDPQNVARYDRAVSTAQRAISSSRLPSVAVIRGVCMGGGIGLALACDLRYCTDDARFRMPAARLGLGYAREGVARMRDILGSARTAELFMTARTFNGTEAARLGMVNEVFPRADFGQMVGQRVDAVAGNAPLTMHAAKLALRHLGYGSDTPTAAEVDAAVQACFDSQDYQEGQSAFRAKRPPAFQGK